MDARDILLMAASLATKQADTDPIVKVVLRSRSGTKIAFQVEAGKAATTRVITRQCSPTEKLILKALDDGLWHISEEISQAIGLPKNNSLMVILGNMAEAGMIESSTRSGYRLAPTEAPAND